MSRTVRLGILHHALSRFGGAAKVAILHSIYLQRMGFDVELFYGGPIPEDWRKRASSEVKMRPLPLGLPRSARHIKEITETVERLRSFDILLVSYVICPFLASYLSKFFGSKLVWYCGEPLRALWEDYLSGASYKTLRCTVKPTSSFSYGKTYSSIFLSEMLYDFSIKALRALDIKTARSYRRIIANSYYTKELVGKVYRLEKNVSVVYPGIDSSDPLKVNIRPPALSNYVLAVGAMIPMKNYKNLLKAFSCLPPRHRSALKLLIIGDGPLKPVIQSTIKEMGLNNTMIKARVSEDELLSYYNGCRFIIHVAVHEPFGLVPLEAALFGKPSVVSNVGGPKETVIDKETGILVNPLNSEEIAAAMVQLLEDEKLTFNMGIKAKERTLREFTMEASSKKLAEKINEIIT